MQKLIQNHTGGGRIQRAVVFNPGAVALGQGARLRELAVYQSRSLVRRSWEFLTLKKSVEDRFRPMLRASQ
ncbi:MAG: hypothetical protein ACPGUF_08515, partial [Litorivicinus sp.]